MSVFHYTPKQVSSALDELPDTHTKEDVVRLIEALQDDIRQDPPGLTFTETVHKHADQHKEIFFSYPMLFRTICKGSYRKQVLDILWDAREAMQSGRSKKEALDDVIKRAVDDVSEIRRKEKKD
jgi:hypothetical protein